MDPQLPLYFLSLKPAPYNAFISQKKKHEFRKHFVRNAENLDCFIYLSEPKMQVVGRAKFGKLIEGDISTMIPLLMDNPTEIEHELRSYFNGSNHCCARPIMKLEILEEAVPLRLLRIVKPRFQPPVSYLLLDNPDYLLMKEYLQDQLIKNVLVFS